MSLNPARYGLAVLTLAVASAPLQAQTTTLNELVVSSSRSGTQLDESPQVVTVISREEIEQQLNFSSDSSQALSNLLPAYTPNRQKMTGSGETFRGRKALFLVDGVPQSNPLRSTGRGTHTIDLSMVERIEVIHGANAIHGLGATGGIINFITRRPTSSEVSQHASIQGTVPTDDANSDTAGFKLNYRVEGTQKDFDYLLGISYEEQGVYTDANGDLVGVDNTQGDLMNSRAYDVFARLGYWIDDNQNVEFEINRFDVTGKQDYVSVDGDRDAGIPTTSIKGDPEGKAPRNQVLTASVKYQHDDLYGMNFDAQAYSQQFEGRFGATLTPTFQDESIAPAGTLYDQSQAESDKLGAKFTLTKAGLLDNRLKLTGGLDLLKDSTAQTLVLTNRYWVPETDFNNYAPFVQAELKPLDNLILNAGVRHEYAELNVDTFQTIASGNSVTVDGGNPSFKETLFNGGLVYKPTNWLSLFGNYSEGFGMADVGRVLRGINQKNQDVDDFLDLEPVITENREIGFRVDYKPFDFELSYYESDSDLGSRLQMIDGTYFVKREKTEIDGYEATLGVDAHEQHRIELAYSRINGKFDSDQDGRVDSKMDGLNIPPNRLTANWRARWNSKLDSLIQASHAFNRSFDNPDKEFDGYTLVDASVGYRLPEGKLNLSVANLFNEDYFTYYSQSAQVNDTRYFKGRGRTVTLGYALDF